MDLLESFSRHLLGLLFPPPGSCNLSCRAKGLLLPISSSSVPEDILSQCLNRKKEDEDILNNSKFFNVRILPLPLGRATPDSASNTELFPELWSPITAMAGSARSFSTPNERSESMRSMQGRTFSSYCWFKLFIAKAIVQKEKTNVRLCL